ncbi:MAG: aromatic-ring-hydroxylating dioxygenase subunit beta [Acinetobacter baumannii]|nr:aromatic-ring-hydroxylating dioxygenase subunit beta [Acinetobacter baumannii]
MVELEEDLLERPIQERFEELDPALRDEGQEELEVRRIVRAVGGSGVNLNYAYDDNHMRKLRVERLENGEAISTAPKANTVRSISRVRVIQDQDDEIVLRCAQNLREFRKENLKHYTADITYHLTRDADTGFKINRKIINLVNSTDTLAGISYIL